MNEEFTKKLAQAEDFLAQAETIIAETLAAMEYVYDLMPERVQAMEEGRRLAENIASLGSVEAADLAGVRATLQDVRSNYSIQD